MVTVVVPLDGSEFAERALRPACAFAARLGDARVLLMSCASDDASLLQAHLDDRASSFARSVDVDTLIIEDVEPSAGILQTMTSLPDALLCMATHGRGGLRTAVLGSVADQVVRRSSEPLVLVGPACRTVLLAGERGRLLVCSDGSGFSETIVPVAASWAARLQLEPWVAEVVAPDEQVAFPGEPVRNRQAEAASARLDQLAARLETPTSTARPTVLHGTPVSRSIVGFAGRLSATLIAMATHGRTGISRSAMGSVAGEVVRHAPCPVLVSRPEATART
jgi:nucleotide-binding universal stress UspA family protein